MGTPKVDIGPTVFLAYMDTTAAARLVIKSLIIHEISLCCIVMLICIYIYICIPEYLCNVCANHSVCVWGMGVVNGRGGRG